MTSYVSMTSYTLTRPSLVTLWDLIVNIGQQQNIGQGKSYWLSGPYNYNIMSISEFMLRNNNLLR